MFVVDSWVCGCWVSLLFLPTVFCLPSVIQGMVFSGADLYKLDCDGLVCFDYVVLMCKVER